MSFSTLFSRSPFFFFFFFWFREYMKVPIPWNKWDRFHQCRTVCPLPVSVPHCACIAWHYPHCNNGLTKSQKHSTQHIAPLHDSRKHRGWHGHRPETDPHALPCMLHTSRGLRIFNTRLASSLSQRLQPRVLSSIPDLTPSEYPD